MQFWNVFCEEKRYPGLWHNWFARQVVAVGWPPQWFRMEGDRSKDRNWIKARNVLLKIRVGDKVVARLPGNRIGRIGEVTGLAIDDVSWEPTVPKTPANPHGENGRCIRVRWDLSYGPLTPDQVIKLPPSARLTKPFQIRSTIGPLEAKTFRRIEDAAKEEANWEGLLPGFSEERAMSDYIASFPQRLESGLRPHPAFKVREIVLDDGRRLDVLLIDSNGVPVVVECKQGVPAVEHIKQLRHYMQKVGSIKRLSASKPRGILVHGGSRKLPEDVQRESQRKPTVELVQYSVAVSFARCS